MFVNDIRDRMKSAHTVKFVTLKPPRGFNGDEFVQKVLTYFRKKNIRVNIYECISENDYIHFHGWIYFSECPSPNISAAIHRFINRCGAFLNMSCVDDQEATIQYVLTQLTHRRNIIN